MPGSISLGEADVIWYYDKPRGGLLSISRVDISLGGGSGSLSLSPRGRLR